MRGSSYFWYTLWVDPAKEAALDAARGDSSKSLPIDEVDNRFWQAWDARARRKSGGK